MLSKEKIRMVKFVLVGIMNTGVDFAVFLILLNGFGVSTLPAQVVSTAAGIANSYWWNRRWTFQVTGRKNWSEAIRFVGLSVTAFAAATIVLLGLKEGLGWPPALAKLVSIVFSTAVNYVGNRYWVFRMESRQPRAE